MGSENVIAVKHHIFCTRKQFLQLRGYPKKTWLRIDNFDFVQPFLRYLYMQIENVHAKKWLSHSNIYLWHWQLRSVPIQITTAFIESTIIFCHLSFFFLLSPLHFFSNVQKRLSKNCHFWQNIFFAWTLWVACKFDTRRFMSTAMKKPCWCGNFQYCRNIFSAVTTAISATKSGPDSSTIHLMLLE